MTSYKLKLCRPLVQFKHLIIWTWRLLNGTLRRSGCPAYFLCTNLVTRDQVRVGVVAFENRSQSACWINDICQHRLSRLVKFTRSKPCLHLPSASRSRMVSGVCRKLTKSLLLDISAPFASHRFNLLLEYHDGSDPASSHHQATTNRCLLHNPFERFTVTALA